MSSFIQPRADQTVSTVNSTTTPLAASTTFTGTSEDVSSYASISIICKSDVAGTLTLQFSNDGTNWDVVNTYIVSGGTGLDFVKVVTAKYYRVTYINGATPQTYFRLQSIAHVSKSVPPIAQNAISAVSTTNSTNSVLLASASFTGTSEDVSTYSSVVVTMYSDQAGSCLIQQSSDGTNWDILKRVVTVAGTQCVIEQTILAKYLRVVYTNGSVDQTAFRLQTVYHTNKSVVDQYDINSATVSAGYTMTTNLAESLVSANIHRKTVTISVTGYDVFIRLIPSATSNSTRMGIFLPVNSTITLSGPDVYKGAISCFNTTGGQTPTLYVTEL